MKLHTKNVQQDLIAVTEQILDTADKGIHSEFLQIVNTNMKQAVKAEVARLKKVISGLSQMSKSCWKQYIKTIADCTDVFDLLLAYVSIDRAIDFYKDELTIFKNMLSEYANYIFSGHVFDLLTGQDREDFTNYLPDAIAPFGLTPAESNEDSNND